MIRDCNFEEISDGRTYDLNDMVKCDTNGCKGCHKCCEEVGSSIVLSSYDVSNIKVATGMNFQTMINDGYIELNMVDSLILPNIKISDGSGCSFLNDEGRCSIHHARPDICRLYPLGRIYLDGSYKYFLQKDECDGRAKSKIKVKKWINAENSDSQKEYILAWHDLVRNLGDYNIKAKKDGRGEKLNDIAMYVLNTFYVSDLAPDYSVHVEEIREAVKTLADTGVNV
jgi:hypothetical protein